ncbi:copper amine oxidase [Aspergillus recurvatus]
MRYPSPLDLQLREADTDRHEASLFVPGGIALLLIGSLAGDALATRLDPSPDLVRQKSRGRKNQMRSLVSRSAQHITHQSRAYASRYASPCQDTPPQEIDAPKENLYGRPELNLTSTENAGEWDNTITLIELNRPNKSETIPYLDGSGPAPTRYAHVRLNNRATVDPYFADILVGPLPVGNVTTWEPIEFPYNRKTQGHVRNVEPDGETVYSEWLFKISASIADITLDLWNGTALGLKTDILDIWDIDPLWQAMAAFGTLLPLGLYLKSDVTGRGPSQWKLLGWMYNDIFYETTEEFREAYCGQVPLQDRKQPPIMVAPDGARYSVDTERKFSSVAYLDSYYGFGPYAFELRKGYDCPWYASYLNTSFYKDEETHTHADSLCLFEFDADYPISRHSTSEFVSVTKNVYLTLRSVSTIGNYDYMFSYNLHMDGTIGVEGSMHDHVLNFKADFDILGPNNTIELVSVVPVTKQFSWNSNKPRNTMQLDRSFMHSEDEARLNWGFNGQTQLHVVNQDKPNRFGEPRDYRILPVAGSAHLTVLNSSNLAHAAHWAEYDVQVTKQHDFEPASAHPYNNQDIHNRPVDFSAFFNGRSLNQTDLVVWLNLGMHHVPHTGDLPNTVFTTAHSSVAFTPLNYLPGDPSRETVNMVRVDYSDGAATAVRTFGQSNETCSLVLEPVEDELWSYQGDVVVRKFPFDPNDPFYETDSDA